MHFKVNKRKEISTTYFSCRNRNKRFCLDTTRLTYLIIQENIIDQIWREVCGRRPGGDDEKC